VFIVEGVVSAVTLLRHKSKKILSKEYLEKESHLVLFSIILWWPEIDTSVESVEPKRGARPPSNFPVRLGQGPQKIYGPRFNHGAPILVSLVSTGTAGHVWSGLRSLRIFLDV